MQNYCISSYVVFIQCECDKCFSFATKWNRRKTRNKTLLKKDRKTYIQVISSKWFDVESFVCTLKFLLTNTANFLQSIAKSDTTKKTTNYFETFITLYIAENGIIVIIWCILYIYIDITPATFSLVRNFHFKYKSRNDLCIGNCMLQLKTFAVISIVRAGSAIGIWRFFCYFVFLPAIFFCPVWMDSFWKIRKKQV